MLNDFNTNLQFMVFILQVQTYFFIFNSKLLFMNNKILILFAHPLYEKSRANHQLIENIPVNDFITFHDLYEKYPDFNIDIEYEKNLLSKHDIIIWHHPFYWYSAPPLLKQWMDMVLEFGWAYGPGGAALKGKYVFNVITTGGTREVYAKDGNNRFTIREFLAPYDQTAHLCKMIYLPPYAMQGTHRLTEEQLKLYGENYNKLLKALSDGFFDVDVMNEYEFMNDWISKTL